jgi:hypothetical protein
MLKFQLLLSYKTFHFENQSDVQVSLPKSDNNGGESIHRAVLIFSFIGLAKSLKY